MKGKGGGGWSPCEWGGEGEGGVLVNGEGAEEGRGGEGKGRREEKGE